MISKDIVGVIGIGSNADAMLLVVDLGDPAVLDAVELISDVLQEWKILPTAPLLTPEEAEALDVGVVPRRALLLGNKWDMPASKDNSPGGTPCSR